MQLLVLPSRTRCGSGRSGGREGNYFFSVNNPGRVIFEDNNPGRMVARDNTLVDCNHEIEVAGAVVEPSTYYDHAVDSSADVPAIVMAGAGVGKIDL